MSNQIHPSAVIDDKVILGENIYIGPNCIIGFPAEYKTDFGKSSNFTVIIEDDVKITGNVTIDAGTKRHTCIGRGSFIMKSAYIAHDVVIGRDAIVSAHTCLGGHVEIGTGVNLGMNAVVHPRQRIGSFSMIGMGTIVTKNIAVLPGQIYVGNPAKPLGINKIGLERNNIDEIELERLINDFETNNGY